MMQKGLHEGEETPQVLNLSNVLKEEAKFLEADMKFKHEVQKSISLDESIPNVKGVYFHFSQSFTNIIKNAMESMEGEEEKELMIESRYDNGAIVIEIHDTGQEAPHIAQGQHPLTSAEMRLVRTRELLEPYGGELTIRSKAHDNLYSIRIPAEE
jgi:nitrogen-specific signal transduction histidine kinase